MSEKPTPHRVTRRHPCKKEVCRETYIQQAGTIVEGSIYIAIEYPRSLEIVNYMIETLSPHLQQGSDRRRQFTHTKVRNMPR